MLVFGTQTEIPSNSVRLRDRIPFFDGDRVLRGWSFLAIAGYSYHGLCSDGYNFLEECTTRYQLAQIINVKLDTDSGKTTNSAIENRNLISLARDRIIGEA